MGISYPVVILIACLSFIIILLLVWKNQRDRAKFERDLNQSEIEPEKHDEDKEDSL